GRGGHAVPCPCRTSSLHRQSHHHFPRGCGVGESGSRGCGPCRASGRVRRAAAGLPPSAAAQRAIWRRARGPQEGKGMIVATLVELLGFSAEDPAFWMPLVFMGLLFASVVAAAVLDGFDIGVGCLALVAPDELRPRMMSLLSPWRDANEFWLFLGMGVFLAAFPNAWGAVMGQLYLPLTLLGAGVLL